MRTGNAADWFLNSQVHAFDLIFVLLEIFLGRVKMYKSQLWIEVGVALIYMLWSWITHGTFLNGGWVYTFLDWSKPAAAFMYPLLVLAFILLGFWAVFLTNVREKLGKRHGKYYQTRKAVAPASQQMIEVVFGNESDEVKEATEAVEAVKSTKDGKPREKSLET